MCWPRRALGFFFGTVLLFLAPRRGPVRSESLTSSKMRCYHRHFGILAGVGGGRAWGLNVALGVNKN